GSSSLRSGADGALPSGGTGAVPRGKREAGGAPADLLDVTITVKYTATQGDDAFATAVKGMLRPYPSAQYFDVAAEFGQEWTEFIESDSNQLSLPITPEHLPGM